MTQGPSTMYHVVGVAQSSHCTLYHYYPNVPGPHTKPHSYYLGQDFQTNKDIPIKHDIPRPRDYLPEAKDKGLSLYKAKL